MNKIQLPNSNVFLSNSDYIKYFEKKTIKTIARSYEGGLLEEGLVSRSGRDLAGVRWRRHLSHPEPRTHCV